MKHEIHIVAHGDQATVSCSCGQLYAQTMSQVERHITATQAAKQLGEDHQWREELRRLTENDHVVLPLKPSAETVVLLGFEYPNYGVHEVVQMYESVTKEGCLVYELDTEK